MTRKIAILVLSFLLLALSSCKTDRREIETGAPDTTEINHDTTVSRTEAPVNESTTAIQEEMTRVDEEGYTHLIWANHLFNFVSPEALDKVNHALKEKGIRCVVELTPYSHAANEDFINWLEELKEEGVTPDIVPAGYWKRGAYDGAAFVENNLYPLNDYLSTEDGQKLWENYGEAEWKSVTTNGKIYNVPARMIDPTGKTRYYRAYYLYVNNKYKDSFEAIYDGSYESLHQLLEMHADSEPIIACELFGSVSALAFIDCKNVNNAYYDWNLNEFVDVTRRNDLKSLLQQMYKDYQDEHLVSGISNGFPDSVIPENTMVYIPSGPLWENKELEGYTQYILSHDLFTTSISISAGVMASSPYRDLAVQVLGVCYSDPKLASLVNWREEDEAAWREWTEYANTQGASPVTGFLPDLSDEEYKILLKQNEAVSELCSRLTQMGKGDAYLEYLDTFFENPKDYGNVYEVINTQFKEWCENETK